MGLAHHLIREQSPVAVHSTDHPGSFIQTVPTQELHYYSVYKAFTLWRERLTFLPCAAGGSEPEIAFIQLELSDRKGKCTGR